MFNQEKVGAIIVAAGKGERMCGVDKLFAHLNGLSVLEHATLPFNSSPYVDSIIVVLGHANLQKGHSLLQQRIINKSFMTCSGGTRRQDSVYAGLKNLSFCQWIIIHDGDRPFVSEDLIASGLEKAQETGAAIAAIPVIDTIKLIDEHHYVKETLPRNLLWNIQTPQVFRADIITKAYNQVLDNVTDDAKLVESLGIKVKIFTGHYNNIKLTTPIDLTIARILCEQEKT